MEKYKKIISYILAAALAISLPALAGCGDPEPVSREPDVSAGNAHQGFASPTTQFASRNPDDLFSSRDKEVGYDEEGAVPIFLRQDTASCESSSVAVSGGTVTISGEGVYLLSGSLEHGMVIVDAKKEDKIQLVLDGVSIQCDNSAPIYVKQADKVFITLAPDSQNMLEASGEFASIDENNIDAAIFSKEDLTLNGTGELNIQSSYGHGIVSKNDLVVTSGTYQVKAARHGICGKDSVCISNGSFTVLAGKDGIHGANDEDSSLGFLYISGGGFSITAEDDGIHTDADLTIQGGIIHILGSYEGVEGKSIDIQGGELTVSASDDGLNASDGSGTEAGGGRFQKAGGASDGSIYIRISGGKLFIDAGGDGIDSNGNLYVEGGEVYVSGAEHGGDSALDYDGEGKVTGGIVAATGFAAMAQNFGSSSTQGAMLVGVGAQDARTEVSLQDSKGNQLLSYSPAKPYDSVVFSHPDIVAGESYAISCNGAQTEVTMDTLVYGSGQGTPGRGQRPGNRPDGQEPPELPEGQKPQELPDGQGFPELPDGQKPPELPDGQEPSQLPDSQGAV